jgi:hypothetical protein
VCRCVWVSVLYVPVCVLCMSVVLFCMCLGLYVTVVIVCVCVVLFCVWRCQCFLCVSVCVL